jgi:hypothetical protein
VSALVARLGLWLLERAEGLTKERCRAYGGILPGGQIRTCEKRRWHWDSHRFDVDPHAYGANRPVPNVAAGGA